MNNQFFIKRYQVDGYAEYNLQKYKQGIICFSFLMEGEALLEVSGKNYLLNPGQLFLVPVDKELIVNHVSDVKGYDGYFSIDYLKDASYPVLRSNEAVLQSFWFDDAVFMGALFKRMEAAFKDKDKRFIQCALDLVLNQVRPGGHIAAVPENFLQMVFEKDKAPLGVSAYASLLGVTANYLNKTVKSHTHRTAIDWIEIARLNLAKKLLADRSISIEDVAVGVGIDDQSYFSRFFKKKTGLTPSQFRNSL